MTKRVVDNLEVVEIDVHQSEFLTLSNRLFERQVKPTTILQPGEGICQRLVLCDIPCALKAKVQLSQFLHHCGFGLDKVEQFHRQIGDCKIGIRQTKS